MIIDKNFWIDENSTPPINYIWLKEGKAWECSKNLNKWKVLDTLNAENFIQVFNSSTEEEKNAIKEALGISSGEGQSSQDSDVVHYSDYCLFTVDPNKPTITKNEQTCSFYPDANADKRSLVISEGTFIIEDNERISLIESSYNDGNGSVEAKDTSGNFTVLVISSDLVEQTSQMCPELGITGPGFLLITHHIDPYS